MAYLLIERQDQVEVLTEQTESGKKLYIEGKFAAADEKNGNGRIYPKAVMEKSLDIYTEQYVKQNRALGELNHPSRPYADPSEAAILIESLEMRGSAVYGKARVLPTPKGQIVAGLLEGGWNAGVSTRGVGSLKEADGVGIVQEDFRMFAVDVVDGPSGPGCHVKGLMESTQQYWLNEETGLYEPGQKPEVVVEDTKIDEAVLLKAVEDFLGESSGNQKKLDRAISELQKFLQAGGSDPEYYKELKTRLQDAVKLTMGK